MRSAEVRNRALGAYDSLAHESAVAEVDLMLRVSARTAASRLDDAWSLSTRLPGTLAALEQGRITVAKARILAGETMNLSDEHIAAVEQQVLVKARQQTPGQLRASTRKAVLSTDPAAAQKRAERARRERGVQMWPEPDGMTTLSAYLPAAEAVGVFAVLDEYARRAGGTGDERSMDARRGDALVDLVLNPPATAARAPARPAHAPASRAILRVRLARAPSPRPPAMSPAAGVNAGSAGAAVVRMYGSPFPTPPYTALLGDEEVPGELAGYGPIPAAVARDLAAGGTWRRILTDPSSGRPVDYGTTRYQPPAHLAGLVTTRDQTCQFPGCRVPAHRCDIDHGIRYDPRSGTGPTSVNNLGPKCRRHHQVKQTPGWSVTYHPDGCTIWNTPSGHSYHSEPPPLTDPEPVATRQALDPDEPPPF